MIIDNVLTKYRGFWVCLALAFITAAVFYQVHNYDFVNYDDLHYVYDNQNTQAGITTKTIKWAFTTGHAANWHPLTWLSHMLDWQLFGSKPAGHHLVNLILHIVNTLLLFIVLKEMTQGFWQSAFVAALFALHPLHVESVAWVSERKDVLSTFFWMLTMWAYLRYVKRPGFGRYLLTLLTFALGLMSKPMLVTLPFVLLLLDYWPLARITYRWRIIYHLIWEKIPFFVLSTISSVVTFLVQRGGGALVELVYLPLKIRILNAIISYVAYIRKMVWPVRLAVFYPYPDQNRLILYAVISAFFLLAITILVLKFAKTHNYLFTGWFWYLGTFLPVIGLIQVGRQAMADRYTYITLTGLFIIIAWGMPDLLAKWRYKQIALTLSAMLVISVLSVCTHFQVRHWQNSYTLFQHAFGITGDNYTVCRHLAECLNEQNRLDEAIENYQKCLHEIPDSTEVLNNLGIALGKQGKFDEAIKYFEAALRIKPDFAEVHINLGITLAAKGEFAEALRHYKTAAETTDTPRLYSNLGSLLLNIGRFEEAAIAYRKALSATPDDFNVLGKLGCALAHTGKFDEAISVLTKSLQIKPDFAEAHTDLGHVLALSGRPSEAVVHLVEALRLDPRSARTHYYLGQVLMQMDKINEAIAHFEEALQFKPDWAELMNDLSWFLATSEETTVRNPEKAVRYAQQACELTDYKRPEFLDTLAAAYAAAGDFGKAVEIAERALTLCQLPEQKPLKEEIDNRLALYKAGKPYIEAQ